MGLVVKMTATASAPTSTPATTASVPEVETFSFPKSYGKIVLTLENVLIPKEKLAPTPSSLDGLDPECETDLRIMGCELIQTSGILLKLPQVWALVYYKQ